MTVAALAVFSVLGITLMLFVPKPVGAIYTLGRPMGHKLSFKPTQSRTGPCGEIPGHVGGAKNLNAKLPMPWYSLKNWWKVKIYMPSASLLAT